MSRRARVLSLQSMYAANSNPRMCSLVRWMASGAAPQQILHATGWSADYLCASIRELAADAALLELLT